MFEKVRFTDYWKKTDVEAYTDGYAYDDYSHLYLLSVGGHEATVKAISSALVSGRDIDIIGKESLTLSQDFTQNYRILSTRFSSGLLHQIVLAEGFFRSSDRGSNLVYVDDKKHAIEIVYNRIKRNHSVPLIPEWSNWLYKKLEREECLEELSGNRKVIRLSVSEEELDSFISEGIKNGEIEF